MPKQIEVLARDISRDEMGRPTELYGTERILTYKSFLFLNNNPEALRYELIHEIDENGKEVPGNPNLNAQHRVQLAPQRNAGLAADAGPTEREKALMAEIAKLKAGQSAEQVSAPVTQIVTERKKPGPKAKPKAFQDVTEEVA